MPSQIRLTDHIRPSGSIVESAEAVARLAVAALGLGDDVRIDLRGARGVPSTFFNVVLLNVADAHGIDAVLVRLRFDFDTPAQRAVYERSLDAVRGAHA